MSNRQLQKSGLLPDVCHNPALPLDLQPVCASQEAASTFKALSKDIHPQIFLLLSLNLPRLLHHSLFLLSNPVAVDRVLRGSQPLPTPDLPKSGHIESSRKELHGPKKFLKDFTSWQGGALGRDSRDSRRHMHRIHLVRSDLGWLPGR